MIVVGQGKTNIGVRSLWFLLLYASDLLGKLRTDQWEPIAAGHRDADLLDAIAEVFVDEVESRLRRELTFQFRRTTGDLTRVRGRVNHLRSATHRLMEEGRVACAFDELSVDSARNRFVAATLALAAQKVESKVLANRCVNAAFAMHRLGVTALRPTRSELSAAQLGRHAATDRRMIDAAHLVDAMAVPIHEVGQRLMPVLVDNDHPLHRTLFEKAVLGYFRYTLRGEWDVVGSDLLRWQGQTGDSGVHRLPHMKTDITLIQRTTSRRIVIDTKFKDALHGATTIDPAHIFQLYAYVMSQAGTDGRGVDDAEGVLLFVVVDGRTPINETVHIQGHRFRFLSVDLTETPGQIRKRWQSVLAP